MARHSLVRTTPVAASVPTAPHASKARSAGRGSPAFSRSWLPRAGRRARPPSGASCTMSPVLARTDAPAVRSAIRASSHGVSAGPPTPAASASTTARATASRATSSSSATSRGTGTHTRTAPPSPSARWVAAMSAAGHEVVGDERRRDAGRAGVEAGQVRLPDRHDRDAVRLEVFEGRGHVEDRLGAGAHDGHRRPAELLEVG